MEEPDFGARDHGKYVSVRARIPKLKAKKGMFGKKTAEAKNAKIENPVFQERFFCITVRGEKDMSGSDYKLEVPLKYKIDPSACYLQTEDDFINVYLYKEDPDTPWEGECRNGLIHKE